MLNILWPIFIIISIVYAIFSGNIENLNNSIFESSESAVNLTLTLIGMTCLWSGIMEIAAKTKIVEKLSDVLKPIAKRLFLDLNERSYDNIVMNIIANILGLGNAATPLGLKAMNELQKLNPKKDTASTPMVTFLILNTAGVTIIPTTILALRTAYNSANAGEIILPAIIATMCSFIAGLTLDYFIRKRSKWK